MQITITLTVTELEYDQFQRWRHAQERKNDKERRLEEADKVGKTAIDMKMFSRRAQNALRELGAYTKERAAVIKETEWMMHCSEVSLQEIKDKLLLTFD